MTNTLHKSILNLAIPATIENILQTLVGFIDTLMIAKLGLTAVTAVGVSNTILNVYLAVYIAIWGWKFSTGIAKYWCEK